MPHVIIETSDNIELKHPTALLSSINQALFATGHFTPQTAIKTRLHSASHSCIGLEPNTDEAFIAVTFYLMKGRSNELKHQFATSIADAIAQHIHRVETHICSHDKLQITVNPIELADSYVKIVM